MKKYAFIVSLIPSAVFAVAISFPVTNLIGVPRGQELGPFIMLSSATFGVLTGICFALLGLRTVKRNGQWLIVDPAEEQKRSRTETPEADQNAGGSRMSTVASRPQLYDCGCREVM